MDSSKVSTFVSFLLIVPSVISTGSYPDQGFFLATSLPESGRRAEKVFIYAIDTEFMVDEGEIEITKDFQGLPSTSVKSGIIQSEGENWGCYLEVDASNRFSGSRYGFYTGSYLPTPGADLQTGYGFVKPKSKLLNTRGIYTVTIYPAFDGDKSLAAVVPIGVAWSSGCQKLTWCKGKKQLKNSGPRLELTSVEDAGLYTISQSRSRSRRGWFAQILVIAASCPAGMYKSGVTCMPGLSCTNGGVLQDDKNDCICPPFFGSDDCSSTVINEGGNYFLLGHESGADGTDLFCHDLPAGNPRCKGLLVCYGGLYGCSCATGWYGNACDKLCPKGRWGKNCVEVCPDHELDCSPHFGPESNFF